MNDFDWKDYENDPTLSWMVGGSYCVMTRKKLEAGMREVLELDLGDYGLLSLYISKFFGKQVHLQELNGQPLMVGWGKL